VHQSQRAAASWTCAVLEDHFAADPWRSGSSTAIAPSSQTGSASTRRHLSPGCFVDASPLLSDLLLELVRDQPNVRVVGEVHRPCDIAATLCETGANCLIEAATHETLPAVCEALRAESPTILVLVDEGRDAWTFEPRPEHAGAMSRERLLEAIGGD